MIYPWQSENWCLAMRKVQDKRLAHAILISGSEGIGKLEFVLAFAQRLNCTQPILDDHACGVCKDCHLFVARTHPDVRLINMIDNAEETRQEIKTQSKAAQIKIDDIRDINEFIRLSRQQGAFKIVCINNAEQMNINAANALLKTLEEPPENSILLLTSSRAESLLATIKSRCQIWKFNVPDTRQSLQWLAKQHQYDGWPALLKISSNRPLLAQALQQSGLGESRAEYYQELDLFLGDKTTVTKASQQLQHETLERLVRWQQSWCEDLVRMHYVKEPITLENQDIRRSLHSLVGRVDLHLLFRFMDKLIELRRFSSAPLNKRLFIEDMLLRCQEVLEQPA